MKDFTQFQKRYAAEQILLNRPMASTEAAAVTMAGTKVDLNPHQIDAALKVLNSPLSCGTILADETGLGKTVEAGLVVAEYMARGKNRIIFIVPAALRAQWNQELKTKFLIDSIVMDGERFKELQKCGIENPFVQENMAVICSYEFAANRSEEIKGVAWDLAVMDEAHKLRNSYKTDHVTGKKLKDALKGVKKILLTATPMQNDLMELYGQVSVLDDKYFGCKESFKEQYCPDQDKRFYVENLEELKGRLKPICSRTLRSQVADYIQFTKREAVLQEFTPTSEEQRLYDAVTDYLQREDIQAVSDKYRPLFLMMMRKLLASSSFAIAGTLDNLINRLARGDKLDLDDFDIFNEIAEETFGCTDCLDDNGQSSSGDIQGELAVLKKCSDIAHSIQVNAKGEGLLKALRLVFQKNEKLGGQRKAVIYTESKRTQAYLMDLLSRNGYDGQIVLMNGSNDDPDSRRILREWKERHKGDSLVTGSRASDMKMAISEEFHERATILIGTEAASQGLNLQCCNIVINYDLPWNPQRIEQRIGRCHRYGQKNDVIVLNFINRNNAAEERVYELLDKKFHLFSGLFGASDEILGAIEAGVDFEKRIADIHMHCQNTEEQLKAFDDFEKELDEIINTDKKRALQSLLDNFDRDVIDRVKTDTIVGIDRYRQWVYSFCLMQGAVPVGSPEEARLRMQDGKIYNLDWKSAEKNGDVFLGRGNEILEGWLNEAVAEKATPAMIELEGQGRDQAAANPKIQPGLEGTIKIDKLRYSAINNEEYLVVTAMTSDGLELTDDTVNILLGMPGKAIGEYPAEPAEFNPFREKKIRKIKRQIKAVYEGYYNQECAKLDARANDLVVKAEGDIERSQKKIDAATKCVEQTRGAVGYFGMVSASDYSKIQAKLKAMQKKHDKMVTGLEAKVHKIQADIDSQKQQARRSLAGRFTITPVMTIGFSVK